jgi:DNA-binding NarL/FixJ family response regulator
MPTRIFLVEDNPVIRDNLIGSLNELTASEVVATAQGEQEAVQWMASHHAGWDMAVIDLFLAQGNGLGVLEATLDRSQGQRVVVLSNYATDDMRARCASLRADAFFDKSNELDLFFDYCDHRGRAA